MNRGIVAIGIVGVIVTLGNVYVTGIYAVLACFDSCSSVVSLVASSPFTVLVPFLLLSPALALILVGWIWQLITLRQMGARGALIFVACFPLIALVAIAITIVLRTVTQNTAPLDFTPLQLWVGEFALALWPLLVSIVAWAMRPRAAEPPTSAPSLTGA